MSEAPDGRVYIHELVEIRGPERARYMQHVTANWSPIGQREREQLCFGVWGTVGSTSRWPEVVNLWEYRSWPHLARSFALEFGHPALQDPSLARWWAEAARFRRGGFDRLLRAPAWSPSIGELLRAGVRGEVYAHETVDVIPGESPAFLERVREHGVPVYAGLGLQLAGAFRTALRDDSECILIWALPDWNTWARFEAAWEGDPGLLHWRDQMRGLARDWRRFLMVDAPLCPLRIGRQPAESDRVDFEE